MDGCNTMLVYSCLDRCQRIIDRVRSLQVFPSPVKKGWSEMFADCSREGSGKHQRSSIGGALRNEQIVAISGHAGSQELIYPTRCPHCGSPNYGIIASFEAASMTAKNRDAKFDAGPVDRLPIATENLIRHARRQIQVKHDEARASAASRYIRRHLIQTHSRRVFRSDRGD